MLPANLKSRIESMIGVPHTYGKLQWTLKLYEVNEERGRVYFYTEEGNSNDRSFEGVTGFMNMMVKNSRATRVVSKVKEPTKFKPVAPAYELPKKQYNYNQIVVRTTPETREALREMAEKEGMNLNRFAAKLLAKCANEKLSIK